MNTWEHQNLFIKWRVTKLVYPPLGNEWVAWPVDRSGRHVHFADWESAYGFALKEARSAFTS